MTTPAQQTPTMSPQVATERLIAALRIGNWGVAEWLVANYSFSAPMIAHPDTLELVRASWLHIPQELKDMLINLDDRLTPEKQ